MNAEQLVSIFLPSLDRLIRAFSSKELDPDPELSRELIELAKLMASYTELAAQGSQDAAEILALTRSQAALIDTRLKIKHGLAVNLSIHDAIIASLLLVVNIALIIK